MLTQERPLLTMHARLRAGADQYEILLAIQQLLERDYGIGHATIQIEPAHATDDVH